MGAHSKAQLILEDILDTSEFFWIHACMKEANETKGGSDGCEGGGNSTPNRGRPTRV